MSKDIQYIPLMTKAEVRMYSLIRRTVFIAGCVAVFTVCSLIIAYCIYLMGWWCILGGLAVAVLWYMRKKIREEKANELKRSSTR